MKKVFVTVIITTAIVISNAMADVVEVSGDFSTPQWHMLGGNGEKGAAESELKDGAISLVGSCMRKAEIQSITSADFTGQVSFYLSEGTHQDWESAALAMFGESTDARAYFMVIFGQPGRQGDQRQIGLFPDQMINKDMPDGKWYTIKVAMAGGEGKMKVWAKDSAEPDKWDINISLSGYMEKVSGVGMRTFGSAVQYDDFDFSAKAYEPISFEKQGLKMELSPSGRISSLTLPSSNDEIQFRSGGYHSGPAWIVGGKKILLGQEKDGELMFKGKQGDVSYSIEYKKDGDKLAIVAGMKNNGKETFKPDAARFMLGINTEMIKYPDWNDKFFPTLIRGEKTHLWGYFMSPKGRVLTIASSDPIASWNYEYQPRRHRIYTVSLDMLHKLPLPERHPQNLTELKPGEEKTWTIYLEEVDDVKKVKPAVTRNINAPMIDIDRYTIADGEQSVVSIISGEKIKLTITDPSGKTLNVKPHKAKTENIYQYTLQPKRGIGQYTFKAENERGKITEASVYVRHPWSWYLKQARKEAIRCPQKAAGCCENWLGHFSNMLAKRYFPDEKLDALAEDNFRTILPALYNTETGDQVKVGRIQNGYYMFSLLTDMYRATGNIEDLELASKIGDWLLQFQTPDGAFRNGGHHYTSVAYSVKSLLELAAAEKELGKTSNVWQERYLRHYNSAKAAITDLQANLDDIGTEGQATYEDGMIGCSATQLAMWALMQDNAGEKAKFLKAATYMFDGHRCLDQMIVPDSRYHEGSLRFWEAQYDVLIPRNMMNSPHGWTAWRIPGYYYMYQLTGEEEWLRRAMNSLGSCVQLIDGETGVLRWSFAQDPYIETSVYKKDPKSDLGGVYVAEVIGEQYLEMISDFHQPKDFGKPIFGYSTQDGSSCDNDVHEIFKALEEVALTAAYVIERADGTLSTYNCTAKKTGTAITIIPAEEVVSRVHLNLKTKHTVKVKFGSGGTVSSSYSGMQWIGPGGIPEDLRVD